MKKILKKLVLIFIICLVSFFTYVKYWAGPSFIRKRFCTAVSSFWDGQLRFESVRFNFFGNQYYKGVSFLDNKGRKWAYDNTINATLGNWPGRDYYIRDIDIDKLIVQLLADTDKKTFPLKPAFPASAPKDLTAVLQSVNIYTGSVSVISNNGENIYLGDMFLLAKRQERIFEISTAINNSGTLDDVAFKGTLSKDHFELNNISGSVCDGKTKGYLRIDNGKSKPPDITGQFRLEEIDMAMLAELADHPGKITTGKATLEYFYTAEKMDLDTLSGHGSLSIDNADILPMPLLTEISKIIGLTDKEIQATSDALVAFRSNGLNLEIDQAYFTNQHEAIVVEPGGAVDLKNRTIDIYVTAIHLRQIGDFIRKVPVLRLFSRLKDKLTRLKIEGQWSDPPSKLIKKEPVNDVKEGVVDFFMQVAQTSGELTDQIIKSTKGSFEKEENE
ncbi:MAG: hypothetical protein ACYSXD_02565 [Planctomycetota bacterium]|jgi:hypothetical protein